MKSVGDYWADQDPLFNELADARRRGHIPDLAHAWLGILAEDGGLPDVSTVAITHKGKPLNRPILEDPVNTPPDPSTYPAKLGNGQVIWVKLRKSSLSDALISASVVDKPDSVGAVLAAMTMMEGDTVDIEKLRKLLPLVDLSRPDGTPESEHEPLRELLFRIPIEPIRLALALLRYYRPGFDALPEEEKRGLLVGCCERMNKTIAATRQLTAFLEYGAPNRDQRPAVEGPSRDVRAAVLRDVEGVTYRKIAASLGIKVSEKAEHVGDYSTVSKVVARGKDILERAFGKDGWEKNVAEMRRGRAREKYLRDPERFVEAYAESWQVSTQTARGILKGEEPDQEVGSRVESLGESLRKVRNYYEAFVSDSEEH